MGTDKAIRKDTPMYTAQIVDGSFHISHNGNGKMRANSKIGIVRLIMSNLVARKMDTVTITAEINGVYTEMKVRKYEGLIYIRESFSILVI